MRRIGGNREELTKRFPTETRQMYVTLHGGIFSSTLETEQGRNHVPALANRFGAFTLSPILSRIDISRQFLENPEKKWRG
jgi:hypothetical protein